MNAKVVEKIEKPFYEIFDQGTIPFWICQCFYFLLLLFTYDWRYARDWLALRGWEYENS